MTERGQEPQLDEYAGFPKALLKELKAKWEYLNDLEVSEVPQVQAGSDPLPGNRKGN